MSVEVYFRGENATALVEKRIDLKRGAIMLFIGGEPAEAYLLEGDQRKPISLAEFSSYGDAYAVPVLSVPGSLFACACR